MGLKTLGVMIDCSRNAVMKPDKVKEFAKLISDMGYNMLQLYTEDTYEIEGEPFFGHMRGRYSQEELKDIVAYCNSIGVEVIPCIQVLAHLNQMAQWKNYREMFDCHDVLMIGDERVYELIDKMFVTLEKCFTSRKAHVGMDEAFWLGRGKYLDKHGVRDHAEMISEHLLRVREIAAKHGFTIMMWDDMYFRANNNGKYLGKEIQLPSETAERVPEGVELVYWDYYSKDKAHYDHMLSLHEKFNNPVVFAGGLWTWRGFAPCSRYTLENTEAAMRSVLEHSIETVIFTLWGDQGKECSYYTALPLLYAAAQMANGRFDRAQIAREFEQKYGYSFEEFLNLELPNIAKEGMAEDVNPSRYLLYNDLFLGLYDFSVSEDLCETYRKALEKLSQSINGRAYDYLFRVEKSLLEVLVRKSDLGIRLRHAYQQREKNVLRQIAEQEIPELCCCLEEFYRAFREMWLFENKAFGLEVQEQRFGGLLYRVQMCGERLKEYLSGKLECIDELEEEALVLYTKKEGEPLLRTEWEQMVSASEM